MLPVRQRAHVFSECGVALLIQAQRMTSLLQDTTKMNFGKIAVVTDTKVPKSLGR
jgi:hypothetical protein